MQTFGIGGQVGSSRGRSGCDRLLGTLAFAPSTPFFRFDELSVLCRYTDHPPLLFRLLRVPNAPRRRGLL